MFTARPTLSRRRGIARLVIIFCMLAFGANLLYTASSKSSSPRLPKASKPETANRTAAQRQGRAAKTNEGWLSPKALLPALMPQELLSPPAITIYASDCQTQKSSFILGETVCAKVTGAPFGTIATRSITWTDPTGIVETRNDLLTANGILFQLPTTLTSEIDNITINNRGRWRVNLVPVGRYVVKTSAFFSVSSPANPIVDLSVYNVDDTPENEVLAGDDVAFKMYVSNQGPNDAQNVQVTAAVPANATFKSETQNAGSSSFTCTNPQVGGGGTSTCTIATLPKGEEDVFTFVYNINAGTPKGTVLTTAAQVTSPTSESNVKDNAWTANAVVAGEAVEQTCFLTCPQNITVTANTEQNGVSGAIVTFGVDNSGTCGAVTASVPSGSFFPEGSTTVSVSSAEGGGECSFTVTVVSSAAPTISCKSDITVDAPNGCDETTVDVVAPDTTGNGVELTAVRSDGRLVTDPYPPGVTTTITWTATDANDRTATCTQSVTVNVNDTTAPTITAPADVTIATQPGNDSGCGFVVTDAELGTATVQDSCPTTVNRTGVPSGNFFPLGTTTVTYTATDVAHNTSQPVTQRVTVTDGTPPRIKAPDDASYVCPSEVPAADASQATRGDVLDANGNLLPPGPPSDNCGTPTVAVTESRSGAGSASSPLIITRVFTATDAAGNTASDTQTITVIDSTPPTLTINGAGSMTVECHTTFTDPGASSSDNCAGPVPVTTTGSVNVNTPGTYTLSYSATDAAGNTTGPATRTVTVVDTTPPTITLAGTSSMTVECHTSFTDPGATASDGCAGSFAATANGSVNVNVPGTYTINYTASDPSGNAATPVSRTVTVVDTTPPTLACPANITVQLPMNSTATSTVVSYQTPVGTDSCSTTTTTTQTAGLASGASFPVGTTTNTFRATDAAGNSASCSFTVTVLYNFTGFFSPVGNLPTLNLVNAGRAIPVKFSLSGNKGLNIFVVGSPSSGVISCNSSDPVIDLTDTVTAGGSSLNYDASSDQYNYVWKTESSWAGTCRQLVVTLNDGSVHRANFKFK